jgi:putative oxidoreductase
LLFILAGISKITGSETALAHVAQHHVPGALLALVVVLEIGAGMALFSGWFVRPAALLLSGFCLATAVLFLLDFADYVECSMFFKDLALAGGLLLLAAIAAETGLIGARAAAPRSSPG